MKRGVGSGVTSPTTESGKSGLPAGIYRRESFAIKKTNIIANPKILIAVKFHLKVPKEMSNEKKFEK